MSLDCSKIRLEKNQENEQVQEMQTTLQVIGFYSGYKTDGKFGDKTYDAVVAFQKKYGLNPDGIFGKETCEKLRTIVSQLKDTNVDKAPFECEKTSLKKHSKELAKVALLQLYLKKWGYYSYDTDGQFGDKTYDAVKAFQTANPPLGVDGVFGPETCKVFNKRVLDELKPVEESHPLVGESFIKKPLHERGWYARLAVLPYKWETYEEEIQTVEETETETTTDEETGEEIETESEPQVTTTTVNRVKRVPLSGKKVFFFERVISLSWNCDNEGLTDEATLRIPYSPDVLEHIEEMQEARVEIIPIETWKSNQEPDEGVYHIPVGGCVDKISLVQENNLFVYEINIVNEIIWYEQEQVDYSGTKKQTEHLKALAEMASAHLILDVGDLPDEDFEVNPVNTVDASGSGGGQTVTVSGNDCTPSDGYESDHWADHRCSPPRCTAKSKEIHGNSSRSYARDTASHNGSAKELVEYVQSRCQYQYYGDNPHGSSKCPENMWNSSGKIRGNCADFARMLKCILDVNGYKSIICHIPKHFYNAIWINGDWVVCDLCRVLYGDSAYGHANHGDIKPTGTWDNPQPRLWIG